MPANYCPYPNFRTGGTCGSIADSSGMCFRHRLYADDKNTARWHAEKEAVAIAKKRISPIGAKQAVINKTLSKMVKEGKNSGKTCAIKSPVCTTVIQGTHHIIKRSPGNVINQENIVLACNACNQWLESHPKEALAMGVVKSKFKK